MEVKVNAPRRAKIVIDIPQRLPVSSIESLDDAQNLIYSYQIFFENKDSNKLSILGQLFLNGIRIAEHLLSEKHTYLKDAKTTAEKVLLNLLKTKAGIPYDEVK